MTYRCATDSHRGRARRGVPTDDETLAAATPARIDPPAAGSDESGVWRAVASLPPRQREAVALRYVADLDHAGIARAMDTSVTMSRRLVSDALVTLRKALT